MARLSESHKGQDNFIRTLPAILARHPQVRYVIAGDGPLRSHFERIAVAAGVKNAVVMTGKIDEVTKGCLVRNCRAFVMLSREAPAAAQFEGFGLVFLEAALAGRPSIAGASGGIPEVVVDGKTGVLVNPSSPIAIADAAISLLENPEFADQLGSQGRSRAQSEFTWKRTVATVHSDLAGLLFK
jgi:phosphatidyl-myo-inositol dimannoside synthase